MVALSNATNHLITKALSQDQNSKEFVSRVKALIKSGEVTSQKEIGSAISIGKSMLSQVMNGHKNIQPYKFKKFNEVYPFFEETTPMVNEPQMKRKDEGGEKKQHTNSHSNGGTEYTDGTRKSLSTLADANKEACISSKEASIANRILAENQRDLILMLRANLGSTPATLPSFSAQLSRLLELMAHKGVIEKRWESFSEGIEFLDKLLPFDIPENPPISSVVGAGKQNK